MNFPDALKALECGQKIRMRDWKPLEYICRWGPLLQDELGVNFNILECIGSDEIFNDLWEIFK